MNCPAGDDILIRHTTTGVAGISISYYRCDTCQSHWIDPFDANYVSPSDLPAATSDQKETPGKLLCPTCGEKLLRTHENAMAPDVIAYYCTTGHGYFFPTGNLRKFRQAQEARISYHKLWDIPLPPLRTVLLASLVLLTGLVSGLIVQSIQTPQQSTIMAKSQIPYHDAIVSPSDGSVTIIARTTIVLSLSLSLSPNDILMPMHSQDGYTHTQKITGLVPGTYIYKLLYQINGSTVQSETFSFTLQ